MSEFFFDHSLAIVLGASLSFILLALALSRPRPGRGIEPATAGDGYHFTPKRNVTFERIKAERDVTVENTFGKRPHRPVGKHPALAAPYNRPTKIFLSPRMLERVNIERRHAGKRPLNADGFKNAISHAWDQPRRQPDTGSDWLTYLILYEVFLADHQQSHCSGTGGITIDTEKPYNGQGGEFAGAGASGSWTDAPVTAAIAGGIAVGASEAYMASQGAADPLSDPNSFKGDGDKYAPGDTVGGYGNSEVRSYQNNPDYAFDEKPAARSEPMPEPAPQSRPDPVVNNDPAPGASVSDSTPSYTSSPSPDTGGGGGGGDGS